MLYQVHNTITDSYKLVSESEFAEVRSRIVDPEKWEKADAARREVVAEEHRTGFTNRRRRSLGMAAALMMATGLIHSGRR